MLRIRVTHCRHACKVNPFLVDIKADLHGAILSHAIFCSAHNLRQAKVEYNLHHVALYVCGYDCRRVLKHVLKSDDIFRVVCVCRKDVVG